ncbi:hypothetical protein GF339_14735 [candidate division KSB3 bacterium]|uniref:Xylulokinase n=1 Tax=candidate division KSB3 bacterium TaxID=2044937 RepID=A0A9D5JWZ4_9BACT|nr:hypothetical protein [candidate division KSB3 bacterium]MBD3325839.1 hypothetical protein [candidate division KSB3 bacterium]
MEQLLLGVDVGTTGVKAVIFDLEGHLQASGQAEHPIAHPHPGWAEQHPEDWWEATCQAIQQALAAVPEGAQCVAGVAVSSQAPTMLPLDREGRPVRPALIWMDRRAEAEAEALRTQLGAEVIEQVTGNRADPFYVAAKVLWFKTHEPDKFAQTHRFVQVNGYINYRLTGEYALDPVHAALLQLRDWQTGEWVPSLCEICGVQPQQFPPVKPGHHVLGEVTTEAADATGLAAGTPVMVGTVDGSAAALEAGAVESGSAAEMTGTSTVLLMPNETRAVKPVFIAMPHCIPDVSLLLGAMATSGASLRWYRDQLGLSEKQASDHLGIAPYDLFTLQASKVPPGSHGTLFLPYMMGERSPLWHTNARGVFFGLSLSTPREALIRAILEGVAFALRHNVEVARQAGVQIHEIRSVGGGTQSALWNQIKADVLGLPILIPETSVGAPFADAFLVGMGLGIYTDVKATLHQMIRIKARYEPNQDNHALYNELYGIFRSIYENLRTDFDRLAKIPALQ